MNLYSLSKEERAQIVEKIYHDIFSGIQKGRRTKILEYFSHEDTYVRKSAYEAVGKIHSSHPDLLAKIIAVLESLMEMPEYRIRQTAINAAGEIGIINFEAVVHFFDKGLFDEHPPVRNAVIGSVKKMGNKNPAPVLEWAKRYLHHPDKEIRREICHGIELRGRTHPEDILPILKELQYDKTARVKNTLIHVLGQISYKKDCLAKVVAGLNAWDNKELKDKAIAEIIDVHERYKDFAALSQQEAIVYINKHYQ